MSRQVLSWSADAAVRAVRYGRGRGKTGDAVEMAAVPRCHVPWPGARSCASGLGVTRPSAGICPRRCPLSTCRWASPSLQHLSLCSVNKLSNSSQVSPGISGITMKIILGAKKGPFFIPNRPEFKLQRNSTRWFDFICSKFQDGCQICNTVGFLKNNFQLNEKH